MEEVGILKPCRRGCVKHYFRKLRCDSCGENGEACDGLAQHGGGEDRGLWMGFLVNVTWKEIPV